ncbi:hypothetical protein D3C78_1778720 [compost metagenome]
MALLHQRLGVVLIVDHHVQQQPLRAQHRVDGGQEPGGEAVGIDADRQCGERLRVVVRAQRLQQLALH